MTIVRVSEIFWTKKVTIKINKKRKWNLNWKITLLCRHSFARFGATLVTLDLHRSGIETIDPLAFIGLTKLENLLLWDNKLRVVPGNWFVNMYNLKTLDLSFNRITVIDYIVFTLLPNLENFYFDYNQIKIIDYNMFQKNPLDWG